MQRKWIIVLAITVICMLCPSIMRADEQVIWQMLEKEYRITAEDNNLDVLTIGSGENSKQQTEFCYDHDKPREHMFATWIRTERTNDIQEELTDRIANLLLWMIMVSKSLESYTDNTPMDMDQFGELYDAKMGVVLGGMNSIYVSGEMADLRWEACPLWFVGTNDEIFQNTVYFYIRQLKDGGSDVLMTEWLTADQEQVYRILTMLSKELDTHSIQGPNWAQVKEWMSTYEQE